MYKTNALKIVVIGSRGIPCNYGGFETFAEHLSIALVRRCYQVRVYGHWSPAHKIKYENFNGVECVNLKAPKINALQKIVLSAKAVIHSLFYRPDIVLFLGVSAAPFGFLSRLFGAKTIVNLDGLEWQRSKWGKFGKLYLRFSEWLAIKTCHHVVADSQALQVIYKNLYGIASTHIAYGADVLYSTGAELLANYGLTPNNYILQACRLEPENNSDLVINAYLHAGVAMPLVILGDAPNSSLYKKYLLNLAQHKVKFLGAIYGEAYKQIVANAAIYVHAHEVGGTNPSLLQAMALGKAPLYLDVAFNREVVKGIGFPFDKNIESLAACLKQISSNPLLVNAQTEDAQMVIKDHYSWSNIVAKYENLFQQLTTKKD